MLTMATVAKQSLPVKRSSVGGRYDKKTVPRWSPRHHSPDAAGSLSAKVCMIAECDVGFTPGWHRLKDDIGEFVEHEDRLELLPSHDVTQDSAGAQLQANDIDEGDASGEQVA